MHYTVDPGLYALGNPVSASPVLVTANYKMSFDRLRSALSGQDAWILVLDTKGINVWCAAGKGTFGTEELLQRIISSGLEGLVTHRELILPQLGAPGIAAHTVKRLSGFKVVYGPVDARDLAAFLDSGYKASADMRAKTFTVGERAVLIPIELVSAFKTAVILLPVLFFLGWLLSGFSWVNGFRHALYGGEALIIAVVAGGVLTPLLLPWLPGRPFALKGMVAGLLGAIFYALLHWRTEGMAHLEISAWMILIPAISAYLGMNFTGCSTYTSLSGVKKEMRWAVPLEIGGAVVGILLWIAGVVTG
jgi:acetyl-CoA decarbonylase/synthase complex subunit gamma